jgi:hypothetical protein
MLHAGACDGYARIARQPALALLHLGPGLGNGLCNLHNARRAGSPVVVMVGDMATWHRAAGGWGWTNGWLALQAVSCSLACKHAHTERLTAGHLYTSNQVCTH